MTKDLDEPLATASEGLPGGSGTSSSLPPQLPTAVIEPSRGWVSLKLSQLWKYREVLYFLVWRDIEVRYRQTLIGMTWAIILFGRLAKMPSDDTPYPLFAVAALVHWTFFANGLTLSANSLVQSGHLITKVYFAHHRADRGSRRD